MARVKISQSELMNSHGNHHASKSSQNNFGGNGSLSNPYSWDEYLGLTDEELGASPCYYINYNGTTAYSLATCIVDGIYNNSNYENSEEPLEWPWDYLEEMINTYENSIYTYMMDGFEAIENSPFPQALTHYNSGQGQVLQLQASDLHLDFLTMDRLLRYTGTNNRFAHSYTINLLSTDVLKDALENETSTKGRLSFISTALTLGQITLIRKGGNYFEVDTDIYDFNMQEWAKKTERNLLTILGKLTNEEICLADDYISGGCYGIILGLIRRYCGTTVFKIEISGRINIY